MLGELSFNSGRDKTSWCGLWDILRHFVYLEVLPLVHTLIPHRASSTSLLFNNKLEDENDEKNKTNFLNQSRNAQRPQLAVLASKGHGIQMYYYSQFQVIFLDLFVLSYYIRFVSLLFILLKNIYLFIYLFLILLNFKFQICESCVPWTNEWKWYTSLVNQHSDIF